MTVPKAEALARLREVANAGTEEELQEAITKLKLLFDYPALPSIFRRQMKKPDPGPDRRSTPVRPPLTNGPRTSRTGFFGGGPFTEGHPEGDQSQ
ncbi:hypothetical protein JTE90_002011 [Oedothorax gibbosus]|uniref:Uncharacterized protein n=1 Tax=Oedothorax gibbosus TaxID=931172 RepID=A0AAV6TP94_9ARAC|nr:hypothetical protein JTE90_002011 [Oedothorax gibbosus]